MAPKSKSIFRQPGVQHFQLVHRSQRDPLINDPEASTHVLKPFERDNVKKGKTQAELEAAFGEEDPLTGASERIGEASLYGVYYDDTEYDYMQHLRPVGVKEDNVESILIAAPSTSKSSKKSTSKKVGFNLSELPDGVLASEKEMPRTYEGQQAIPESISGFRPDMDAHLRQVLEALEDDAFVDDGLEDDFFGELVAGGERGSDEEVDFEFNEDETEGQDQEEGHEDDGEFSWQNDFAKFKKQAKQADSDDEHSEGEDTVGTLPAMSVIGGKRRRKGTSDASGYTMSSSSMYRNDALQTLDARFDQMIMKNYNEDEEEDEESDPPSEDDEAPELITSRDDFDSMINTFLNDYEIIGRKLKPKLEGETGVDKLNLIRQTMGQDERVRSTNADDDDQNDDDLFPSDDEADKHKWDCETILTTFSNLENHPRVIRVNKTRPVPKIILDKKTGLPSVAPTQRKPVPVPRDSSETSDGTDTEQEQPRKVTFARPRNESKEEKQARKHAAKVERQTRRATKKERTAQFDAEYKQQKRALGAAEPKGRKL